MTNNLEEQLSSDQHQALSWSDLADRTSSLLLVPAFPRPEVEPPIYTHALSRVALGQEGKLKRIDIQLLKMIEAAKTFLLEKRQIRIKKRILLFGFSASAMFVNRFTFLHPTMVRALAFGAPGGWPLAPLKEFKGKILPYPIGVEDVAKITGREIDLGELRKVPIFAFIGSKDENDSVVFRDGYTKENQDLVFALFGKTPVERWPLAEKIYKDVGLNARFKIYEGLGHETSKMVMNDVAEFFKNAKRD